MRARQSKSPPPPPPQTAGAALPAPSLACAVYLLHSLPAILFPTGVLASVLTLLAGVLLGLGAAAGVLVRRGVVCHLPLVPGSCCRAMSAARHHLLRLDACSCAGYQHPTPPTSQSSLGSGILAADPPQARQPLGGPCG